MSQKTFDAMLGQIDDLTDEEKRCLAARLVEQTAKPCGARRRFKWRDIRGMARPSMFGEDAQAWVSRTRAESDEHRERQLRLT